MAQFDYYNKETLRYVVSYSRPDSDEGVNPFGVTSAYAATFSAKLVEIFNGYIRLGSADVQSQTRQMAILSAANMIASITGLVLIPQNVKIEFTRFPVYNAHLKIPVGPVLRESGDTFTLAYTTDTDAPYANTVETSIEGDASTTSRARLFHDGWRPRLTLRSGQIWPVPLWSEEFPVRLTMKAGLYSPVYVAASTSDLIVQKYGLAMNVHMHLAAYCYEQRSPVLVGASIAEMPFTLKTMLMQLKP